MVAHPIQDMSEVSIAHTTVGIRLPRLRCSAIAETRPNDKTEFSTGEENNRTVLCAVNRRSFFLNDPLELGHRAHHWYRSACPAGSRARSNYQRTKAPGPHDSRIVPGVVTPATVKF